MSKGLCLKITLLCCTPALLERFQTKRWNTWNQQRHVSGRQTVPSLSTPDCTATVSVFLLNSGISNVPSTTNSDKWHGHKWANVCKNGHCLCAVQPGWKWHKQWTNTEAAQWRKTCTQAWQDGVCVISCRPPADGETPQDFLAPFKPSETEMAGATWGKWLCESSDEFFLSNPVSWIHFWTVFCETVILRDEICSAHIQAPTQLVCCVSISLCL